MERHPLHRWHHVLEHRDLVALEALLDDEVVFHSPVVRAPQAGKRLTLMYLGAAFEVFINHSFRYVREVVDGNEAVLEFEVEIDGIAVNGVDMISFNDAGRIIAFKVMLRPLKAINLVHQKMGELLARSPALRR